MDKELFKKTEGKLYRYYRAKKEIVALERKKENLEKQIKGIEWDIKNVHVNTSCYQGSMGIQEKVQSSITGESYFEKEIMRAIEKLERDKLEKIKRILKINSRLRNLDEFIKYMQDNLSGLSEECKKFVDLKYGDKKNILAISRLLNLGQATAYRMREEILENINNHMWMFE